PCEFVEEARLISKFIEVALQLGRPSSGSIIPCNANGKPFHDDIGASDRRLPNPVEIHVRWKPMQKSGPKVISMGWLEKMFAIKTYGPNSRCQNFRRLAPNLFGIRRLKRGDHGTD